MDAQNATDMCRVPSDVGPSKSPQAYLSEIMPTEIILMIVKVGDLSLPDLAALA